MTDLLIFWSLVLLVSVALVLVREVYDDEPYGAPGRRTPPRSHEPDLCEPDDAASRWRC